MWKGVGARSRGGTAESPSLDRIEGWGGSASERRDSSAILLHRGTSTQPGDHPERTGPAIVARRGRSGRRERVGGSVLAPVSPDAPLYGLCGPSVARAGARFYSLGVDVGNAFSRSASVKSRPFTILSTWPP